MKNVVIRSLILFAVSTAIVPVSAFVIPPANTTQGGMPGHSMSGISATLESEEAFITVMIPHHQEAVKNALAVLETTKRPEIRELAQNVIATRTEEVATLEAGITSGT